MTDLRKNIDHYMELKGIKMYSHLLADIAGELGRNIGLPKGKKQTFQKCSKGKGR